VTGLGRPHGSRHAGLGLARVLLHARRRRRLRRARRCRGAGV